MSRCLACVLCGTALAVFLGRGAGIELISKDHTGRESAKPSGAEHFLLSEDGRYVVFDSSATNIVAGDTNRMTDVFVYDRVRGSNIWSTTFAHPPTATPQIWEGSTASHLTPNGRYLVFASSGTGFVSGVAYPRITRYLGAGGTIQYVTIPSQIYVRDLWSNVTVLASVSTNGQAAGHHDSSAGRISDDGRFVAFKSSATNLVSIRDGNGEGLDIFCRDLVNRTTEAITVTPNGARTVSSEVRNPAGIRMSTNGRYFAFETEATNVVQGLNHTNHATLAYWRDRVMGTTRLVAGPVDGRYSRYWSTYVGDVSPDGRYVCFASWETNIVSNVQDPNGDMDVFMREMPDGETWMVTRTTNNIAAMGYANRFSRDGRHVLFTCPSTAIVRGVADGNGSQFDWFMHHVASRSNALITASMNPAVSAAEQGREVRLSRDGRFAFFMSYATNLIAGTTTRSPRFYVRDTQGGRTLNALRLPGTGPTPGFPDVWYDISANGRVLGFVSFTNLDASVRDENDDIDLFVAALYPPLFLSAAAAGGTMAAEGISNERYILEASTNLSNWTVVNTNTADEQGFFAPRDATVTGQRFFRLRWRE